MLFYHWFLISNLIWQIIYTDFLVLTLKKNIWWIFSYPDPLFAWRLCVFPLTHMSTTDSSLNNDLKASIPFVFISIVLHIIDVHWLLSFLSINTKKIDIIFVYQFCYYLVDQPNKRIREDSSCTNQSGACVWLLLRCPGRAEKKPTIPSLPVPWTQVSGNATQGSLIKSVKMLSLFIL